MPITPGDRMIFRPSHDFQTSLCSATVTRIVYFPHATSLLQAHPYDPLCDVFICVDRPLDYAGPAQAAHIGFIWDSLAHLRPNTSQGKLAHSPLWVQALPDDPGYYPAFQDGWEAPDGTDNSPG